MIQNYKKLFFFSFSSSDYPIYSLSMGFFLDKGDLEGKVEMKSSLYISTLNQTNRAFFFCIFSAAKQQNMKNQRFSFGVQEKQSVFERERFSIKRTL